MAPFALAVVAGLALPLSLAPFDWPLLDFVSVALLFVLVREANAARAAWLGWCFGLGKYGLGASWVYVSIHDYGHATPLLAGALVALFVALLALFPALMTASYASLARAGRSLWERAPARGLPNAAPGSGAGARSHNGATLVDALTFAACWVLLDWALTWVLTGFPWLYAGYAHLGDPLRHLAPVGGVLLVSLAVAVSATSLVALVLERRGAVRVLAAVFAMLPWLAGAVFGRIEWVTPGPGGRVTLVQGNIPQDLKWLGTHTDEILDTYRRLSRDRFDTDLVVWPEAAVVEFEHRAGPYLREMDGRARAGGAALVLGIPALERLPDGGVGFLNTVQVVGLGEGRYVKRRLVPFGEYVPLEGLLRGAIEFFDLPMSHAVSGAWHQPLLVAKDWKLATAICYEIVYPDLVRASAADADVIVTLSNDAWFGASIGPHQHLQMVRMRALENGRYVLRATNNGITAIVDADGRVTAELPQFEEGVLEGRFEVPRGRPPFVRLGEWPVLVLAAALLLLPLLKRGQARA